MRTACARGVAWPASDRCYCRAGAAQDGFDAVSDIVRQEIAAGHARGAVVPVGRHGKILYRAAYGAMAVDGGNAIGGGWLHPPPSGCLLAAFAAAGKSAIAVRQLLTHMSGLRPKIASSAA